MMKMRTLVRLSLGLGILSTMAVFLSNLALIDIWHGESDLRLEWGAVRVSYAVFILFHISALITFTRLLRGRKIEEKGD